MSLLLFSAKVFRLLSFSCFPRSTFSCNSDLYTTHRLKTKLISSNPTCRQKFSCWLGLLSLSGFRRDASWIPGGSLCSSPFCCQTPVSAMERGYRFSSSAVLFCTTRKALRRMELPLAAARDVRDENGGLRPSSAASRH